MNILLLLLGFVTLLISGDVLVRGGVSIASRFHVSKLVIGMTLVSLGTSAPELVVSLQSVLTGHADLSMGTVIGSNMANIGFILGLTILITPMLVNKRTVKVDTPVMLGATFLLYLFIQNGSLNRWEGALFSLLLIAYIVLTIYRSRKEPDETTVHETSAKVYPFWISLLMVVVSIVGLRFGAGWLVTGATEIARSLGVSEYVISITVLAVGTSLPELATSLVAAVKKESDISIGNIVGSNLFNVLGILGITALVKPIGINNQILSGDIYWLAGMSVLLFLFMIPARSGRLVRAEGAGLILLYGAYIFFVIQ